MKKYPLVAVVDRTVTDIISLTVEAESESAAYEIAGRVLEKFPHPHNEEGVSFCFVEQRKYHDPELMDLRDQLNEEDEGAG